MGSWSPGPRGPLRGVCIQPMWGGQFCSFCAKLGPGSLVSQEPRKLWPGCGQQPRPLETLPTRRHVGVGPRMTEPCPAQPSPLLSATLAHVPSQEPASLA